jgi:hypothetical protein
MSLDVAKTILEQLGGRHFLAMTGAKNLVGDANSLSMKLPNARCNGKRCTGLRIVLDPSDTYTVEAIAVRKLEYTVLDTHNGVYCDNLRDVFTSMTGLDTYLL